MHRCVTESPGTAVWHRSCSLLGSAVCSKAWAGLTLPRVTPRSQPEAASPVSLSAAPSPAQQLHLAEGNHSGRAILSVTERYTLCYRAILRLAERYSALQSHTLSCRAILWVAERCSALQSDALSRRVFAAGRESFPAGARLQPSPAPPARSPSLLLQCPQLWAGPIQPRSVPAAHSPRCSPAAGGAARCLSGLLVLPEPGAHPHPVPAAHRARASTQHRANSTGTGFGALWKMIHKSLKPGYQIHLLGSSTQEQALGKFRGFIQDVRVSINSLWSQKSSTAEFKPSFLTPPNGRRLYLPKRSKLQIRSRSNRQKCILIS